MSHNKTYQLTPSKVGITHNGGFVLYSSKFDPIEINDKGLIVGIVITITIIRK